MKIVLTGATGFVGSEVLKQLIEDSRVTHITCVVRRPPGLRDSKVDTILHPDFAVYDEEVARRLARHDACIWALGGKAFDNANAVEFERVTYTFTMAFATAVARNLTQPFRLCYLSGMGADPGETSSFPWEKATRHLKGRTERNLESLSRSSPFFRATSFRPAGILPASTNPFVSRILAPISIKVDKLARAMIHEAISQPEIRYRVVHNSSI